MEDVPIFVSISAVDFPVFTFVAPKLQTQSQKGQALLHPAKSLHRDRIPGLSEWLLCSPGKPGLGGLAQVHGLDCALAELPCPYGTALRRGRCVIQLLVPQGPPTSGMSLARARWTNPW